LASPTKLRVIEIDFASSHGTMPSLNGGIFAFATIGLAKVGKRILQKYVTLQAKGQANKSLVANCYPGFY